MCVSRLFFVIRRVCLSSFVFLWDVVTRVLRLLSAMPRVSFFLPFVVPSARGNAVSLAPVSL